MTNSNTFVKITNKDVYEKVTELDKNNTYQHEELIHRIDFTNGKVKLNRWVASTALAGVSALILFLSQNFTIGG